MAALMDSNLPDLTLISKGKVRDIYSTSSPDHLLFVATDRISVYDVVLQNVGDITFCPGQYRMVVKRTIFLGYSRQGETPYSNITLLV
jgi:hypothetical protein